MKIYNEPFCIIFLKILYTFPIYLINFLMHWHPFSIFHQVCNHYFSYQKIHPDPKTQLSPSIFTITTATEIYSKN